MFRRILSVCVVLVAIASLTACKKDYEELIVGRWQIDAEDGFTEETIFNDYIPEPIEHMDNWGFVFHSKGIGYSYEVVEGVELVRSQLTYTIDGSDIHIIYGNGVRIRWTMEDIGKKSLKLSERYELYASNGDRRYGFGRWKFRRMEYVAPVLPSDVIDLVDSLAEQKTVTTKKLFTENI